MKSLKILSFIFTVTTAALLLAGCGPDSARYDTPEYVYVNSLRGGEIRLHVKNVMTDKGLSRAKSAKEWFKGTKPRLTNKGYAV